MEEWTIPELQQKMASGELTARKLAEMYLGRIVAIDQGEVRLNAVIELNPDALAIAERLDRERREGLVRSPLHGIPIMIKDNIDTCDRMTTSAGSLALEGSVPLRDAFLVERLRAAGALILGKTNLSEWANFRSKNSTSGWSSRGGLTRNPYALDRSACGSSSGSGAAVAANLCAAAVGTETDGSIICPAQTNGIVGIKPTVGLVSRSGIIPISHSQDTAGPMARTVREAAILLGGMTGVDDRDAATSLSKDWGLVDYTPYLDPQGLNNARLGVARSLFGSDARLLSIMDSCLDVMRAQGALLIEVELPPASKFEKAELEVLLYEFKAGLDAYLASLGKDARVHSLADVVRFNDDNRARVQPFFGQDRMLEALEKGPLTSKRYLNALERSRRLSGAQGIDAVMKQHTLDALVCLSGGAAWTIDLINGDGSRNWDMESASYPAAAGYPHITVPAGSLFGLPVGISFIASAWQEPALIRLAYAFEQATRARVPPRFLPTADLSG